jgi:hypothetical protein
MSRRKPLKPFWERAYKGHAYWLGKQKLGKVRLLQKDKYSWEAAGRAGLTEDLDKAKRAVELAVLMAERQLDLFNG